MISYLCIFDYSQINLIGPAYGIEVNCHQVLGYFIYVDKVLKDKQSFERQTVLKEDIRKAARQTIVSTYICIYLYVCISIIIHSIGFLVSS